MIILRNFKLPLDTDFDNLLPVVASNLKLSQKQIKSVKLYRKSIDARHKNDIFFNCSIVAELFCDEAKIIKKNKNAEAFSEPKYVWKKAVSSVRPVVVGFGPAGMFAALTLARAGLNPIVIERGFDVDTRQRDVDAFLSGGQLNPESNVQFGEGGAGTFSDGKLNTGIKDIRCREVLKQFVAFGAPDKILYAQKPHIGTDILVNVVKNLRQEIISLSGEVRFGCRLQNINAENGNIKSVTVEFGGELQEILCNKVILASGHSARDVFELLKQMGVSMQRKPFAMGSRIEHKQKDINNAMYGEFANNENLGAADYKLAVHLPSGRGVYTFCMCPGGEVINSSSEQGGIAVNGMSFSARDGENANSAVLVEIKPEDLNGDDILSGVYLQREIEQAAYNIANGLVPFCYVGDLLKSKIENRVDPTVKPETVHTDIYRVLPRFVVDSIKSALPEFDKKIKGFAAPGAVLTFPETRSSSPVRITRNENYVSVSIGGLYPTGEGAGYAGGIMSAAVDGMRVAEAVIDSV